MHSAAATLFLPISRAMLEAVLDDREPLGQALEKLSIPQIATLIVIQHLPTTVAKCSPSAERMLIDTIELGVLHAKRGHEQAFRAEALGILDRDRIRAGCEFLPDAGILFLNDEDVAFRNYLLPDGNWNPSFVERHRAELTRPLQRTELPSGESRILTSEQSKIYHEIRGGLDDHLHVQGYAGTGKSFLIKSLLDLLQKWHAQTLVLAEHRGQLNALLVGTQGIEGMHPRTFGDIVRETIPTDLTNRAALRMRANQSGRLMPDDELIRWLGVYDDPQHSAQQLVKMVRDTVYAFCSSDDGQFEMWHLPAQCMQAHPTTRQVVLHHATELWKAILQPPMREFDPLVRNLHRVKWAALQGLKVPPRYTHILVDECHNLARPMMQILNRSSQTTFSLGDQYQNLQGQATQRTGTLRHREVTHSVRAGGKIAEVVNPLINAHPAERGLEFHGSQLTRTEINYYDKAQVPDQPAVILVSDLWGLFEWAQRLAEKTDFLLLNDGRDLRMFVEDLVELYQHESRPRHRELFRFTSWQGLGGHFHRRRDFQRIDALLKRGFDLEAWARTSARCNAQSTSGYALGLISDALNREFQTVMLAPDIVERSWGGRNAAPALSAAYVAVTRARRRLIVPRELNRWIADISSSSTG